jgi:hypothetical protein
VVPELPSGIRPAGTNAEVIHLVKSVQTSRIGVAPQRFALLLSALLGLKRSFSLSTFQHTIALC